MSHNTITFILQPPQQFISSFNCCSCLQVHLLGGPDVSPNQLSSGADSHLRGGRGRGSLGPSGSAARQAGAWFLPEREADKGRAHRRRAAILPAASTRTRSHPLPPSPAPHRTAPRRAFTPHAAAQVSLFFFFFKPHDSYSPKNE